MVRSGGAALAVAVAGAVPAAAAQDAPAAADARGDVVVIGKRLRGSAIGEVAPVAALDAQALRALGASNMKELADRLKPLAQSVTGEDPAYLLNGRRISGFAEVQKAYEFLPAVLGVWFALLRPGPRSNTWLRTFSYEWKGRYVRRGIVPLLALLLVLSLIHI